MDWFFDFDYDYGDDYEDYDSDSTFISYHSGISNNDTNSQSSSSSSSESSEGETQDTQPSYMIVNSGTGGIHPRRTSGDDDASQVSSSGSTILNMDSDIGPSDNSENEGPPPGPERYYLRNLAGRQGDPQPAPAPPRRIRRNDVNGSIYTVSSDSETDVEPEPAGEDVAEVEVTSEPAASMSVPQPSRSPEPANPSLPVPAATSTPARTGEKRKCSSPVSKKARLDASQSDEDGVDAGCNICYDSYTAVGPHRPVCLKCGHIFGFSCVERWLKVSCANGNKRCPTCNKKAHMKDIRYLYCCNLRAVDNTRVHQLSTDLEQEKIQNSKYKIEITGFKIKVEGMEKELARFRSLERSGLLQAKSCQAAEMVSKVPVLCRTIALCKCVNGSLGMARSLVYDEYKKLLLATHQNDTSIFSGFGYSLFSLLNVVQSSPAHKFCLVSQKAIRDAAFHPNDSDLILIVSLDKTAKLIDVRTGTRIHTFHTDYPLWSCAWDLVNPNLFLVGGVNGQLARFDKRETSAAGQRAIATGGTNVGVVSILGIKPGPGRGLPRGGFLVCKLNAVLAVESTGPDSSSDIIRVLDTSGPFMSMSYLASKNQVLLSSRPAAHFANIRHRVFTLDHSPDGTPVLSLIQTIQGGSLAPSLTRSYIWPEQVQGHSLVYAYDAASKCLCGWSVSDAVKKVSLPCNESVLDICRVEGAGEPMLAALSDAAIHLYRHPS